MICCHDRRDRVILIEELLSIVAMLLNGRRATHPERNPDGRMLPLQHAVGGRPIARRIVFRDRCPDRRNSLMVCLSVSNRANYAKLLIIS